MRPVLVWGNCQAEPVASLLTPVLRHYGLEVVPTPPVYLATPDTLRQVRETLSRAAVFITQPIRDEYLVSGCGSDRLAALLPDDARTVRIPVTYDTSLFPFQVRAHRADGSRVDAPLTDYHDLRAIVAAERGLDVEAALTWWPSPDPSAVRAHHVASLAEMISRETTLDVSVSDLLPRTRMFTMSHPENRLLGEVAARVLRVLGFDDEIVLPQREFLGARRTPVESAVITALGLAPAMARPQTWVIEGRQVSLREILTVQLPFYDAHLDIVTDARHRFADRLALLGLS